MATGLDYGGVRDACALAGIDLTEALFFELRVMEGAALNEMNRRRG